MSTLALEVKNLTKRYGEILAVDQLNLNVRSGEIFGLLGPNGAGKSTTIGSICGLLNFQEGQIKVFGYDVKTHPIEAKSQIGLASQDYNIDPFMPLYHTLDLIGGYFGLPAKERKKRIGRILHQLDLTQHAKKPFLRLSGGMKRRAILARALICDPNLLILDEPTAALDVELRYELWTYIQKLNKEGKTIILTSHYIEEIERLCENIAIIHHGRLLFSGPKKEFMKSHQNLEYAYRKFIQDHEN